MQQYIYAPFALTTAYSTFGFKAIPKFAGIVQGVVVQMINFVHLFKNTFSILSLQSSHKLMVIFYLDIQFLLQLMQIQKMVTNKLVLILYKYSLF